MFYTDSVCDNYGTRFYQPRLNDNELSLNYRDGSLRMYWEIGDDFPTWMGESNSQFRRDYFHFSRIYNP